MHTLSWPNAFFKQCLDRQRMINETCLLLRYQILEISTRPLLIVVQLSDRCLKRRSAQKMCACLVYFLLKPACFFFNIWHVFILFHNVRSQICFRFLKFLSAAYVFACFYLISQRAQSNLFQIFEIFIGCLCF